jgi:putative oxidoreductase
VMTLLLCGVLLGAVGPGRWSLDHALDLTDDLTGKLGLVVGTGGGIVGAAALLAVFWRPSPSSG